MGWRELLEEALRHTQPSSSHILTEEEEVMRRALVAQAKIQKGQVSRARHVFTSAVDFGQFQLFFRVRPFRLRPISTSANFDFGPIFGAMAYFGQADFGHGQADFATARLWPQPLTWPIWADFGRGRPILVRPDPLRLGPPSSGPEPEPAAADSRNSWRTLGPLLPIQKGSQQSFYPLLGVAPFAGDRFTWKGHHSPKRGARRSPSSLVPPAADAF